MSFRTSLLALVELPWMVTFPAMVVDPALIVPLVAIVVEPPMDDAPLMIAAASVLFVRVSVVARPTRVSVVDGKVRVPVLTIVPMSGAVSVLLVRVSVAASVTTMPEAGKVAVEFTPVPPLAAGKVPVTPEVKGRPVKLVATPLAGVPSAGVTSVGLFDRTKLPVPVEVVTPVPPLATARVPETAAAEPRLMALKIGWLEPLTVMT